MELDSEEIRIGNIALAIMGKWENETVGFLFLDTPGPGELGDVWIGPPDLSIYGQSKFQIFIKDDLPFLKLINDKNGEEQIKEYEMVINKPVGELVLKIKLGGEWVLHRNKQQV